MTFRTAKTPFHGHALATLRVARAGDAAAPLIVVATSGMVAGAGRVFGGDRVQVTALTDPGVDPHGYPHTRSDIHAKTRTELVPCNGLSPDAQLEEFLLTPGSPVPVAAVAEAAEKLLHHADDQIRADPHVWMAPPPWHRVVTATAEAMAEQRPDAADIFSANAEAYLTEIDALNPHAGAALQ